MKLNPTETIIFDKLESGEPLTMDDLLKMLDLPASKRHAMVVRMKYLSAKLAPEGYIITNVGGIGRGKRAEFVMRKKF